MPSVCPAIVLGIALIAPSCGRTSESPAHAAERPKVRGIIVSTHRSGEDWGTDAMPPTLRELRALGANWVAIHPYAAIGADGSVRARRLDPRVPDPMLVRPIREAHALGLKIAIIPHLAYWGSPFRWRGDIHFDTPEQWERFWQDYRRWIVTLAEICRDADGFLVGNETDLTLDHEVEWRRLIAEVRSRTRAPLTYAANWTHYRKVRFWDALDVIGIQAYFPVADRSDAGAKQIEAGWRRILADLRVYAREQNRAVLFTELGYNRSYEAPVRPWDYHVDGLPAEAVQERCLRAALRAIESEPSVAGVFLWKWFPGASPAGRDFALATPQLRRTIADAWGGQATPLP